MARQFNIPNWYWTDASGGHAGQVFSSAGPGWVATSDSTYLAWVAAGNTASPIANDGDLAYVLAQAGLNAAALAVDPSTFTDLAAIQVVTTALAAGCALTSSGTSALNGTYETSGPLWEYLQSLGSYIGANSAFPNAASSWAFPVRGGTATFSSTAHALAAIRGISDYRFAWLAWLLAGGSTPTWGAKTIA